MTSNREYTPSWLAFEQTLGERLILRGTAAEQRAAFAHLGATFAPYLPPPSPAVQVSDVTHQGLRMRIYRPTTAAKELLPIGLFAHGGGYVCGSLDSEDFLCRALVERVRSVVVSVEYRLAPECKAPAQMEDAVRGFEWAHAHAAELHGDAEKMYTIGGSAGGGLALGVARQIALGLTTLPRTSIKGVVALVPQIFHPQHVPEQFKAAYTAYTQNGTDVPMIDKLAVDTTLEMAGIDASNADYLVGMDVESLKFFPPTYIATCEFDPLRDDGKILATALGEVGVEVKHDHYEGLPHCFWFVPMLPETGDFMEKTVRGVEWIIGKM